MLNAQVIQIQQLSWKHKKKTTQTCFGQLWIEVAWDSRGVEDIRRQCLHHFAWTFVNEKTVFKVDATFAQSIKNINMLTIQSVVCNCFNTTKEFLCKYVTMDETWIHHFTVESNRQSAEWTAAGESYPKQPKTQTSAGKVLATVFWDAQGILFIEKGRTINSKYYIELLLRVWRKTVTNEEQKVLFHHVTSWSWQLQNYINCTSNCFCTHPILQIWPPVTTGCLKTSNECSRERDLAPIKKQ